MKIQSGLNTGTNIVIKKTFQFKCFLILLLIIITNYSLAQENTKNSEQTNQSSFLEQEFNPSEPLNVHVVPHSHDDAGWLRTFERYYDGSKGMGCVKCILDTMLQSLEQNQNRTFTYVEMSFFEKWYKTLTESDKLKIQFFVKEGRLEFLNGGWVMNDEATTHYQHIIDQFRLGMLFLKKEFDVVPKTAWLLDPFGHSVSNAYLMRKLSFENMVIVRIDFRDKEKRKKNKELEFVWKPYADIDKGKCSILTHITWGHYSPDSKAFSGFFERYTMDAWRIKSQMETIYLHFVEIAKAYRTNEILFLYGDDFEFSTKSPFENIEKLMLYFSENDKYKGKINLFYSTPSRYFKALNKKLTQGNIQLPEYSDKDFFPYADNPREYWTGYFTSRPYLKGLVRDAGNFLSQTSQFLFGFVQRSSFGRYFSSKENKDNNDKNINLNHNSAPNNGLKNESFNNINENLNKEKFNTDNNNDLNNNINHHTKGSEKNNNHDFESNGGPNNSNPNNKPEDSTQDKSNISYDQYKNMLPEFMKKMDDMRRELAIAQHHDSVTGTARDDVSDDYILRLENAILGLSEVIKALLVQENPLTRHKKPNDLTVCLDSVAYSACVDKVFKEEEIRKGILLTTLNPGFNGKYPRKIKINLNFDSAFLKNSNKKISMKKFQSKLNNNSSQNKDQFNIHEELEFDLFFDEKSDCYFIYYVLEFSENVEYYNILIQFEGVKSDEEKSQNKIIKREQISKYVHGTNINYYRVLNEEKNILDFYLGENKINFIQKIKRSQISNKIKNNLNSDKNSNDGDNNLTEEEYVFSLSHAFYSYSPSSQNRQGAYLMSTNTERPDTYALSTETSSISIGKIVTLITLKFEFSTLLIRIYNPRLFPDKSFTFELETILHKLEPKRVQKEFLLMINSNIDNLALSSDNTVKPYFFTDSNAMRIIKRIANTRETFELDAVEEKAAGNFYPVNSVIFLQDSDKTKTNSANRKSLFLFNDRAQGATSVAKGEILIDINRWSDRDDRKGLADGLNELQSSTREFSVTHLLALSRNFDYESLKNFMENKPLTAVYFDYFGINGTKLSNDKGVNTDVDNNNTNLINKKKVLRTLDYGIENTRDQKINRLKNLFVIGNKNCFHINYYFVSESKILVQFYNKSDPLLFNYANCTIKLLNDPHIHFSKLNLNGIEKKNRNFFGKEFLKKRFFISLDNLTEDSLFHEMEVPQQDFETILVEF